MFDRKKKIFSFFVWPNFFSLCFVLLWYDHFEWSHIENEWIISRDWINTRIVDNWWSLIYMCVCLCDFNTNRSITNDDNHHHHHHHHKMNDFTLKMKQTKQKSNRFISFDWSAKVNKKKLINCYIPFYPHYIRSIFVHHHHHHHHGKKSFEIDIRIYLLTISNIHQKKIVDVHFISMN